MNIGSAIQLARSTRKLSQADLAKRAGISVSYLSLLERDKRDPPVSTVTKIADALGIPVELLFFLAAERTGTVKGISKELAGQLAYAALELLNEPESAQGKLL